WADSATENGNWFSLSQGSFADDFEASLLFAASEWGVRHYKFDMGGFRNRPRGSTLPREVIYRRSVDRFVAAVRKLRAEYPDVIAISHTGFGRNPSDVPLGSEDPFGTDPAFLEVIDGVFSGDPHMYDVPQTSLVRSVDMFQDRQVWKLHREGFALDRIEDHGVIVGETNTCHYRGRAGFPRSYVTHLSHGGRREFLYGDLSLLGEDDADVVQRGRRVFLDAWNRGLETRIVGTGEPGSVPWHGYLTGGSGRGLLYLSNTSWTGQVIDVTVPNIAGAKVLFFDGDDTPVVQLHPDSVRVQLAPERMVLVGLGEYATEEYDIGCDAGESSPLALRLLPVQFRSTRDGLAGSVPFDSVDGAELMVVVRVFSADPGRIQIVPAHRVRLPREEQRRRRGSDPDVYELVDVQVLEGDEPLPPIHQVPDVRVWSGVSWILRCFRASGPCRISVTSRLDYDVRLEAAAYAVRMSPPRQTMRGDT
ncbi:MAG: hypothetical protein ACOCVK_02510, partial [bacterium]